MSKISKLLVLAFAMVCASIHAEPIIDPSPFSERMLRNKNASEWLSAFGMGTSGNIVVTNNVAVTGTFFGVFTSTNGVTLDEKIAAKADTNNALTQSASDWRYLAVLPENLDNGAWRHSIGFKVSKDLHNWVTLYNETTNYNPNLFNGAPCILRTNGQYIVAIDSSVTAGNQSTPPTDRTPNSITVTISTNLIDWTPPIIIPVTIPGTSDWEMYGSEYFTDGTNTWLIVPVVEDDNGLFIETFALPVDATGTNFGTPVKMIADGEPNPVDGKPFKLGPNRYIYYGTASGPMGAWFSTNPVSGYTKILDNVNASWSGATSMECPEVHTNYVDGGYILIGHPNPSGFGRVVWATSQDCTNWTFRGPVNSQANSAGRFSVTELNSNDQAAQRDIARIFAQNQTALPFVTTYRGTGESYYTPYYMSGAPSITRVNYHATGSGGGKVMVGDVDVYIASTAGSLSVPWVVQGISWNRLLLPTGSTNGWSMDPVIEDSQKGLQLHLTSPNESTVWNVTQTVSENYCDVVGLDTSAATKDYTPGRTEVSIGTQSQIPTESEYLFSGAGIGNVNGIYTQVTPTPSWAFAWTVYYNGHAYYGKESVAGNGHYVWMDDSSDNPANAPAAYYSPDGVTWQVSEGGTGPAPTVTITNANWSGKMAFSVNGKLYSSDSITVTSNALSFKSSATGPSGVTNGACAVWSSNGVPFLRYSSPGATTSTDKPL